MVLAFARIAVAQNAQPYRDLYSDTWVATDALGRQLPGPADVGSPRTGKTVGMFYFLTFDHDSGKVYDNTKILAAHPEALMDIHNPALGPLNAGHYWGEPLFGYYVNTDDWVLRKHAQMLTEAGVDVVIFDNSNAVTYDPARDELLKVWEEIRREGGTTPQVAFLCPFSNWNNIGTKTLCELYDKLYGPGLYSDLWFRWDGKPLVMAYQSYADIDAVAANEGLSTTHNPVALSNGSTLGQTVTVTTPFYALGGEFPTWNTTTSGLTLSLYENGPGGKLLARKTFTNVTDNAAELVDAGAMLPAGKYYLEASNPVGQIGWWGYSGSTDYGASLNGNPDNGTRSVKIRYQTTAPVESLAITGGVVPPEKLTARAKALQSFFTFRAPIAPYNEMHPQPGYWGWLQIYPQAPQTGPTGKVEQVTVGVAQNYNATVNNTAPMSYPGAFGRSYHKGKEETAPGSTNWGYNFQEQWDRALQLNPPFVFITGWNEWTAGFYDSWAGFNAPPAIFVDEFTEEFSRDIEPMTGGHGDDYYYQLVSNVRRYKGVRTLPPITRKTIKLDGGFSQWTDVEPEYRDAVGDTAPRNSQGVGDQGPYTNNTGRNDIVAAQVAYDAKNIYFYVRTAKKLTPRTDKNWMLLYINTGQGASHGWLGYDYVVNRKVTSKSTSLETNIGGYNWRKSSSLSYYARGNELVVAVPRAAIGLATLPPSLQFKWADNCYAKGDWTDFILNGDAAPDGRFNYLAKFKK